MRKIKIMFIIDYLSEGGGTENQLKKLIMNLDKSKFEPVIVTLSKLEWAGLPEYSDTGIPHKCLEIKRILSFKTLIKIISLAKFIRKNKIDIIQTFFVDANIIGVLAGILSRIPKIIVSRRDMGYWYTPRILKLLKFLVRFVDYYMVNSKAIKNIVVEKEGIKPEQVVVFHNGVFLFPDNSPSKLKKTDFDIPEDAKIVGLVANLRKIKRIDNFIRVASMIENKDCYFVVIGIGFLKDDLLEQAKEAGLEHRLKITHTLKDIFEYIKLFDVGVLSSDSEGLSNTLIEYHLCGIPSVAFDVGGNNEVIEDNKTGYLIEHGDLDNMKSKIEFLLNNDELGIELGRNAVISARDKFNGDKMISRISEFYNGILDLN